MEEYTYGGGQFRDAATREFMRIKREDPEEYARRMRPAKIRLGVTLSIIGVISVGWMIFCMVVA